MTRDVSAATEAPEARYPGTYRDARGSEPIEIRNDGRTLRTTIRGVPLAGSDFDGLEPADAEAARAAGLVLDHGSLCGFEITCDMPIGLTGTETAAGTRELGTLGVHLTLGTPGPTGRIDREVLRLTLTCARGTFHSAGTSGYFEDELSTLQRALPAGLGLHACISCGLSDYSPYGHGLFGGLACFRGDKPGYRAVTGKRALFQIWSTLTELVQETHVCPEFERRAPGTGYRG